MLLSVHAVEAVPGTPTEAGATVSARRAPRDDDEVAPRDVGHTVADALDRPGGLVSEQERELVVNRALAVVKIGVADSARLHSDEHLARTRVRDQNILDGNRRPPGACYHSLDLV